MKDESFFYTMQVKELTRRFGNFIAVDRITFDVKEREIFGFLGANGAGKTTTIRMLTGLLQPSSGYGNVAGLDIHTEYEEIKKKIGYMSQKFSLYEDLSVRENLVFFGGIYGLGRKQIAERIEVLGTVLGIEKHLSISTRSLPLGFKQRLALACSILHDPKILFLDEPTGGVDPIARRNFWNLISHLASEGTTIFVTTHYMEEAEYCHRLSIMYGGRIIEMGSPGELKKKYSMNSIEDIFIHLVDKQ
ncbi:MAG: ABC transporter ATP-binding protein [Candidatus Aureabacteria bacterium]|nr:ABC transporter ATP-binding protein [Candidatus Auribacterota bacterium]